MGTQPTNSTDGLSDSEKERVKALHEKGKAVGLYGGHQPEPVPTLEKVESERIFGGENNSFMVLGRDRPGHTRTGAGSKGATQCGRIDLISGLGSSYKREDGTFGPPDENTILSPNFALDAARIYVSQKTDLDRYMGITKVPGQVTPGISGIGLKADSIRIHSRHDVKIVTGRARLENLGADGERLSDGTVNDRVGTISFIAGNFNEPEEARSFNMLSAAGKKSTMNNKLQPLVKGRNLVTALDNITRALQQLNALVGANTSNINTMNANLAGHIHTVGPIPTTPSPTYAIATPVIGVQGTMTQVSKATVSKIIDTININFLEYTGKRYINSKHVFTT